MTPERRVIAAAVSRLRSYVASGGRPYLTSSGRLALSTRREGQWSRGASSEQGARESADTAFFSALRNEDALRHITRAVRVVGVRQPLGHIIMGAE